MPFVVRDDDGKVIGTYALEQFPGQEFLAVDHPQVEDHLGLSLEKRRGSKLKELKEGVRGQLAILVGDLGDNVADMFRAMVLARGIEVGLVTDPGVISRFDDYCRRMLEGYGGAEAILGVIEETGAGILGELMGKYYPAKLEALAASSLEDLEKVRLKVKA